MRRKGIFDFVMCHLPAVCADIMQLRYSKMVFKTSQDAHDFFSVTCIVSTIKLV